MSDLISRQAAIDALLGITAMRNTIPLDSAIFNIKKLPPAQPKTGKWILDPDGYDWNLPAWVCSECHCKNDNIGVNLDRKSPLSNPMMWEGSKFCPNCGADMRGVDMRGETK